nr:reverse transcriptase domain-containing protein [Tanacetum cinerariifolium]
MDRHQEVPNTTIKLSLFPFSLEGEARTWLDKEPPRPILTWEDLVSKLINQFFPPSKTTYLRHEIINFLQTPNETFNEAWEHFKDLLRQCPHHGFSELHQLDTFYNSLNPNDQDALDSAAGGNFLDKIPRECLTIIESKSKVRYSRSHMTNSRVSTNALLPSSSSPSHYLDLQQIAASLEDKQCPHHGFSELHQLDTFYNSLNPNDQDALDSAAGGNFLDKIPRECLTIIESKSKVRYSRSHMTNSRVSTNALLPSSSSPSHYLDLQQIAASLEDKKKSSIEEPEHSFSMGYEHFSTTLVTELDKVTKSSIKNLVPIPRECEVTSNNESESNEPVKDDSSVFTTFSNPLFNDNESIHDVPIEESKVFSNPLFDNDEINSDELESHVESDSIESLSNHDALIDSHMEMLFTINPRPRPTVNANMIIESFPSSLIPVQDNDSQQEEIDIVTNTDEVLPLGFENDYSEEEIDTVDELHVYNSISNSENELSDNVASDFDNPSFPRPPAEPPDAEFDFELGEEISVVRNTIDEFECLDPRDEFDVSNDEKDDYFPFMFAIRFFLPYLISFKMFLSFLSVESDDTIFDPGISV